MNHNARYLPDTLAKVIKLNNKARKAVKKKSHPNNVYKSNLVIDIIHNCGWTRAKKRKKYKNKNSVRRKNKSCYYYTNGQKISGSDELRAASKKTANGAHDSSRLKPRWFFFFFFHFSLANFLQARSRTTEAPSSFHPRDSRELNQRCQGAGYL